MKNKLGIFTALILSLAIAGSALAAPKTTSVRKAAAVKIGKVSKTMTKKTKKHHRKRKAKTVRTAPAKTTK